MVFHRSKKCNDATTYMKSGVYFKASSPRVPFRAASKLASERLKPCMSKLVGLEMSLSYKSCFADGAQKWTLASVGPHVGFEVAGLGKFFQTVLVGTKKHLLFILRARNLLDLT